jgi:hypothetical protein
MRAKAINIWQAFVFSACAAPMIIVAATMAHEIDFHIIISRPRL